MRIRGVERRTIRLADDGFAVEILDQTRLPFEVVVRELVGVYEFVTSPFEIPKGYAPIIEPEFPWSYFDEPARKR